MKQAIVGFGFFITTILTVLIVMALAKENTEQNLLEQSVELAIYQSLQEGMETETDPGILFIANLSQMFDEELLDVEIIESDEELGILSVTVDKKFENFGNERTIEVSRTVIYEREL